MKTENITLKAKIQINQTINEIEQNQISSAITNEKARRKNNLKNNEPVDIINL